MGVRDTELQSVWFVLSPFRTFHERVSANQWRSRWTAWCLFLLVGLSGTCCECGRRSRTDSSSLTGMYRKMISWWCKTRTIFSWKNLELAFFWSSPFGVLWTLKYSWFRNESNSYFLFLLPSSHFPLPPWDSCIVVPVGSCSCTESITMRREVKPLPLGVLPENLPAFLLTFFVCHPLHWCLCLKF